MRSGPIPYMPAPWFARQGQVRPPELAELQLIRSALLGVLKDGHREALLKCLRTWSTVQAGTFRSDEKTIDILKKYPGDSSTRSAADTTVRAMWGAHKGAVHESPADQPSGDAAAATPVPTFAGGKSIRAMAEEAGLLDFYRQAYSLASGVAHSEWWSIETHAMEPCLNVLHGLHLIPSLSLSFGGNVPLASSWVDQFYSLVRTSLGILGTDDAAVSAAFAWLDESAEEGPEPASEQPQ